VPRGAAAPLVGGASKNRKKKKKALEAAAAPAGTVTHGFHTPSTAADSDRSAVSSPRVRPASRPSMSTTTSYQGSPRVGPSELTRVLSNFRLQPEAMYPGGESQIQDDCDTPGVEIDAYAKTPTQTTEGSYEIPLVRDFASVDTAPRPLTEAVESQPKTDTPHRKMTADDFDQLKCLGKGAYGTVILVRQRSTGRLFAQKQLKKATLTVHKDLIEQAKTERQILESVNRHPFVVKLFYAFQDHAKLYLILEYAPGGELFHHLAMERTFTEEVSAFYMAEMVLALEYLHLTLGVVYRDLKPENCLLDSTGHLLLTDFGLSKVALDDEGDSRCNSTIGTTDYMAPEVVLGKAYDAAVDWWSLGAVGFDLLTGSPPFAAGNTAKIKDNIVHGKLALPYYLSPDAKDLLTRLLRKEPTKRLGSNMPKDLGIIKKHRFFRRIEWKALERRETEAPIQPIITDPAEVENFDKKFTDAAISPVEGRRASWELEEVMGNGANGHGKGAPVGIPTVMGSSFNGFSYVAPSSLLEASMGLDF